MVNSLSIATAFFAATALASNLISDTLVMRAEDVLFKPYASLADPPTLLLSRRQNSEPPSSATSTSASSSSSSASSPSSTATGGINPPGSINITEWETETGIACVQRLSSITRSSNPSGACICYNLPSLDPKTGAFEADLRVYRISEPRDEFAGVKPSDIRVGLAYTGASVTTVRKDAIMNMGMMGNVSSITKRDDTTGPTLLHSWWFVGQIDKDQLSKNLSMSALESVLMPTLTLTAQTSTGNRVSSNVSLNEAAFITGAFSDEVVMSDFAAAQVAVDDELQLLSEGKVAFVVPGVQIMIFPIGAIITGAWLAIGLAVYGFGTYERMQYAAMYKARMAATQSTGSRPF